MAYCAAMSVGSMDGVAGYTWMVAAAWHCIGVPKRFLIVMTALLILVTKSNSRLGIASTSPPADANSAVMHAIVCPLGYRRRMDVQRCIMTSIFCSTLVALSSKTTQSDAVKSDGHARCQTRTR